MTPNSKRMGRNDPCRCGSGSKYKKCCLSLDRRIADVFASRLPPASLEELDPAPLRRHLQRWGIEVSREELLELAGPMISGKPILEAWLEALPEEASREDRMLVGAAFRVLWKELLPDVPTWDQIEQKIEAGFRRLSSDPEGALEGWWSSWETLSPRLPESAKSLADLESVVPEPTLLGNWLSELSELFRTVGCRKAPWPRRGVEFCRWILDRFPEEDEHLLENTRANLSWLLFHAGEEDEALSVADELVRSHPHRSAGYCLKADLIEQSSERDGSDDRLAEALATLEAAAAHPVEDGPAWDLDLRTEDLRSMIDAQRG